MSGPKALSSATSSGSGRWIERILSRRWRRGRFRISRVLVATARKLPPGPTAAPDLPQQLVHRPTAAPDPAPRATPPPLRLPRGYVLLLHLTSLYPLYNDEVPPEQLRSAQTFVNVGQQRALSSGVGVAALVLDGLRIAEGRTELVARDFQVAFVVIAVIAGISAVMFLRLRPDAGADVSGHRGKPASG